jgi:hypothetical protein
MMIEAYKRYDGQALGSEKVGGAVVRKRRRLVISKLHHKPSTKTPLHLSQTHLETD